MRVIEPGRNVYQRPSRTRRAIGFVRSRWLLSAFIAIAIIMISWYVVGRTVNAPNAPKQPHKQAEQSEKKQPSKQPVSQAPAAPKPKVLKTFSGEEFRALFESTTYPNVQEITGLVNITGNATADARIVAIAEGRGYKKRSIPAAPITKIGNTYPDGDDLLQPLAIQSWQVLRDNAIADGINIRILSAYRSPELQRSIFTNRLYATGVTAEQIAAGQADAQVNEILVTSSIPGYSRHHTGYTIDLQCDGGTLEAFVNTRCFAWISANNYEQAKKAGWIPSYPEGVAKQGPEPEPWEYVWVGTERLYQ